LTSSGAVYGKQPEHLHHIPEDYLDKALGFGEVNSAYADGKRASEQLCAHFSEQFNLNIKYCT
jgi:dTDP-glucose 4,6-dehydratase